MSEVSGLNLYVQGAEAFPRQERSDMTGALYRVVQLVDCGFLRHTVAAAY